MNHWHLPTAVYTTSMVLVALLLLGPRAALADGSSWTGRRGEPLTGQEFNEIGEDVARTAGPPAGSPIQGQELEERTTALASTLRCPVCQSQSIQDSTTEAARNMRSQLQAMLAAGYDEAQVLLYFEHSYGEFIRLLPRAEGFNLLVWILPLAALLIGLLCVASVVRNSMSDKIPETPSAPSNENGGLAEEETPEEHVTTEAQIGIDPNLGPWLAQVRQELAATDD